jgi:hypothetical protein
MLWVSTTPLEAGPDLAVSFFAAGFFGSALALGGAGFLAGFGGGASAPLPDLAAARMSATDISPAFFPAGGAFGPWDFAPEGLSPDSDAGGEDSTGGAEAGSPLGPPPFRQEASISSTDIFFLSAIGYSYEKGKAD